MPIEFKPLSEAPYDTELLLKYNAGYRPREYMVGYRWRTVTDYEDWSIGAGDYDNAKILSASWF